MQQNTPMNTPSKRRVLGPCSHVLVAANTGSWRLERPEVAAELCVRALRDVRAVLSDRVHHGA